MTQLIYPATGLLPAGAHFENQRIDQGHDFATNWRGAIQAPGNGVCIRIGSDRPFPSGFGPSYPVVRITSGPYGGHEWYAGHTSARVRVGEHFSFGHVLSLADQGYNFNGTHGGWCEFGEAFNGSPGPNAPSHWYDHLITHSLIVSVPDPVLRFGDKGRRVLQMSGHLRDCGYLSRPWFHFNAQVHGAVVAFKRHHHLPIPKPDGGVVDAHTNLVITNAANWCKKHRKHEV